MKNIVVSLALCLFNILGYHSVSIAQSNQGFYATKNAHLATKQRRKNLDAVLTITKNDYYRGLEIFNGESVKRSERKTISPGTFKPFSNMDEVFNYKKHFHEKYKKGFYATKNESLAMKQRRKIIESRLRRSKHDYYQRMEMLNGNSVNKKERKPINPDNGKPFNNLNEYMEYLSKFY